MPKSIKGVWFFGLAGSGKTFASQIIANRKKRAFVVDGDEVRRLISFDLGYTPIDRQTQIQRVTGIAELALKNKLFPIISTVFMTSTILDQNVAKGIAVIEINRPFDQLREVRPIYDEGVNVMGKDIVQEKLEVSVIHNDGTSNFEQLVIDNVG